MHDANDIDSLDDDFYSGETEDAPLDYYSDYDDEAEDYFEEADRIESRRPEQNFTILKESDIKQRQEEDVNRVATVLSISRIFASILLRYYNWSVSRVHDAWFADEERVRKAVGLLEKPIVQHDNNTRELTCGICFENYPRARIEMASCGHPYCISCWEGASYSDPFVISDIMYHLAIKRISALVAIFLRFFFNCVDGWG